MGTGMAQAAIPEDERRVRLEHLPAMLAFCWFGHVWWQRQPMAPNDYTGVVLPFARKLRC